MSKKLLVVIALIWLPLIFSACDKIPDGVVENRIADYTVTQVNAPASAVYSVADSSVVTSIKIENASSVSEVWCSVSLADGSKTVREKVEMLDDGKVQTNGDTSAGDNIFSGKFIMSKLFAQGSYEIRYFVKDNINTEGQNVALVAIQKFNFSKGENNTAPVISDLQLQQSVSRGESFIFTLKASDQNGLNDITAVYFKLYRPDGSQLDPGNGLEYFLMHDDGNTDVFGDAAAGDGIFSFKNSFGATAATGDWKFEFRAKDRSGELSNTITQNLTVN